MKEILYRTISSILMILILFYAYLYDEFFFLLLFLISAFAIIEYCNLIFKISKKNLNKFINISLGSVYLIIINFLIFLNITDNKNLIFYFIIICIATDIGGLVAGKIFKGRKLTKISPKKTYSGFYGSFFFAYLAMFLSINYLDIKTIIILIITFSVCLLSQLGDLFFSFLKRKAKVKDTGNLLPGHGGILDRIDGIIISVPINLFIYNIST
mgnify:FL=1